MCDLTITDNSDATIKASRFHLFGGCMRVLLTTDDDGDIASIALDRNDVKTLRRWLKENMPDD